MRSHPADYEVENPATLDEALALLARAPGECTPLAGGTDLMVLFESGVLASRRLVNLGGLDELRGIEVDATHVTVGALTTFAEIRQHPVIQTELPMLCEAARVTGAVAIQARGTLGGNIANASPAADSPPALLTYDAELELVSADGLRAVAYDGFHTGYKTMDLSPGELVRRIRIPRRPGGGGALHYYRKVGTRRAQAISKVCFAGLGRLDGGRISHVRIALGAVAPTVVRCHRTEALLQGRRVEPELVAEATGTLRGEIAPIDDVRSTAAYRAHVSENLLVRFLTALDASRSQP